MRQLNEIISRRAETLSNNNNNEKSNSIKITVIIIVTTTTTTRTTFTIINNIFDMFFLVYFAFRTVHNNVQCRRGKQNKNRQNEREHKRCVKVARE